MWEKEILDYIYHYDSYEKYKKKNITNIFVLAIGVCPKVAYRIGFILFKKCN